MDDPSHPDARTPDDASTLTAAVGAFVAGSGTAEITEETRELVRRHVLDTLASIVACRDLEPAIVARRFALAHSGDAETSAVTILGTRERAALVDAVFAGAMTAHGAEINDFIPSAFVQPGPAVVSTALGLAERRGLSGEAVLRSIAAGYELAGRIPKALGVANLRRAGIANHGVGPVFGAAATAASLIGLPEERIGDVLACCAEQASGSGQWMLDVEHIEKSFVFAGMGARNGLQAVLMVEAGFRGVRGSLDHPGAWMSSRPFADGDGDRASLLDLRLGAELHHTAYKRHPVGGPTQPAVTALLGILPRVDPGEVERVLVAMPGRWQTFRDAAMPALNLRYLCAVILLDGRLDFVAAQSLERMHGDPDVAAFMERVDVVHDPAQESPPGSPRTESATVTVTLRSGEVIEEHVHHVLGFPSHPMDRSDVEEKAMELMEPLLGAGRARDVVDHVWELERMDRAGDLATLIAR